MVFPFVVQASGRVVCSQPQNCQPRSEAHRFVCTGVTVANDSGTGEPFRSALSLVSAAAGTVLLLPQRYGGIYRHCTPSGKPCGYE